jgi:hypothetical protein
MTGGVPFWASEAWSGARVENGVRMYTSSKSRDLPGVLGMVSVPAPAQTVLECLLDARRWHEWDPSVCSARYLDIAPRADVVFLETKHALVRQALLPLLLPRAFCVSRVWLELPDGSYVLLLAPTQHPLCPDPRGAAPGLPRFALASFAGAIAVRPCRTSKLGYQDTLVVYLCNADVGSPYLRGAANRSAQVQLVAALAGLREACSL